MRLIIRTGCDRDPEFTGRLTPYRLGSLDVDSLPVTSL